MSTILLVTVTKTEAQAVLEVFSKASGATWQRQSISGKTYYALGKIGGADVYMVQSEMGASTPGGALITIHKAIEALNPGAVIMVGIAFGSKPRSIENPDGQELGDILVARQIMAYEPGKVKGKFIPRGDRVTCSTVLLGKFRDGDLDWQGAKVRFGLVLSGEKLVNDLAFRTQLLKLEPEAIGGEMEGAGLYAAASEAKVDWILVKAICDWADGNKDDKAQPLAARNAADFVRHVIGLGGWENMERKGNMPENKMAGAHIEQKGGDGAIQVGQARDVNINTGPVYNVHAGRDVIQGDQFNTTTNIINSTTNISNATEFVGELRKLQLQIAALKSVPALDEGDVKMLEVIEGRVQEAAKEAQKPQPVLERITTTLEKAKKTMDSLGGSVTSAVGLGTALGGLIKVAMKLFGG